MRKDASLKVQTGIAKGKTRIQIDSWIKTEIKPEPLSKCNAMITPKKIINNSTNHLTYCVYSNCHNFSSNVLCSFISVFTKE